MIKRSRFTTTALAALASLAMLSGGAAQAGESPTSADPFGPGSQTTYNGCKIRVTPVTFPSNDAGAMQVRSFIGCDPGPRYTAIQVRIQKNVGGVWQTAVDGPRKEGNNAGDWTTQGYLSFSGFFGDSDLFTNRQCGSLRGLVTVNVDGVQRTLASLPSQAC